MKPSMAHHYFTEKWSHAEFHPAIKNIKNKPMKYILSLLTVLLSFTAYGQLQIDRSHAPAPGPAPEINIGTPATFTTDNGIKVFVVESHKVPKVTVSLILKKDPIMEGDKVGYVGMSGTMMRRGTQTKTKAELDKAIDFLGGSVHTSSGGASASSLSKNFDKIFALFADVILNPAFRDSELVKVKTRTLSSLEAAKENPGSIMSNVVRVVNYGKSHPYGEIETPETVKNISVNDLKSYYNTFWKPNIAYMAFVGDISVAHARELVDQYLGQWKEGQVPDEKYAQPQKPGQTTVYIANRPSAVQTNIDITAPIELKPGASDYFAIRLMDQVLGGGSSGWLFQDLREKYGFTYGAYSSVSSDPLVGSFAASAAVRTAVTDSALQRFMFQLNRIRNDEVSIAKLDSAKNIISGHFALSLERPSRIAQFALSIARYDMPKDYYKNYLKSIDSVTVAEIQQVAREYITPEHANIVLVGNAKVFADSLDKYGRVQYVDIYGNPIAAPVNKSAPEDVTAADVVNKYLDAIGGRAKLETVKDLTIKASADMRGQTLALSQKYLLPDHYLMTMSIPSRDMTIMKTTVNGDSVSMQRMGQNMPLSPEKKQDFLQQANPFPEMTFLDGKHKLELTGIESINGKEAYALKVTDGSDKTTTYYFDTKTGLELRQVTSIETPQKEMQQISDISDYKAVDGILFPSKIASKTGPMTLNMTIDSIEVNSGLTADAFK